MQMLRLKIEKTAKSRTSDEIEKILPEVHVKCGSCNSDMSESVQELLKEKFGSNEEADKGESIGHTVSTKSESSSATYSQEYLNSMPNLLKLQTEELSMDVELGKQS